MVPGNVRHVITIDLGSTNTKTSLFDEVVFLAGSVSKPIQYKEIGNQVTFDPAIYIRDCIESIKEVVSTSGIDPNSVKCISLTGQAETFAMLDESGCPIHDIVSWKDNRSETECSIIWDRFSDIWFETTGLPTVSTTWSATKLLWFKRNDKALFDRIRKVLLVKDFVAYSLTKVFASEFSVFGFSGFLDKKNKRLWKDMVDFVGLKESYFPQIVEPGTIIGNICPQVAAETGLPKSVSVCIGALDHDAGLVGTNNLAEGNVTLSTGTVQAMAMNVPSFITDRRKLECHYSFTKDRYIQLLVIESGGVCLQWFKDNFIKNRSFKEIDEILGKRPNKTNVTFLPYVCGLNPPEYDPNAHGAFIGFDIHNDALDFAQAIMEGSGYLLRKNLDFLTDDKFKIDTICAIGGASHSSYFNQLVSDITKRKLITFKNSEASSLGCFAMGAVATGLFKDLDECTKTCVVVDKVFCPSEDKAFEDGYGRFLSAYKALYGGDV